MIRQAAETFGMMLQQRLDAGRGTSATRTALSKIRKVTKGEGDLREYLSIRFTSKEKDEIVDALEDFASDYYWSPQEESFVLASKEVSSLAGEHPRVPYVFVLEGE